MAKKPKLTKEDVKQPDQFQKFSAKLWKWAEDNIVNVLIVFGGAFILGLGWVGFGLYQDGQKLESQTLFFKVEKPFLDKRDQFEEAKALDARLKGKSTEEQAKLKKEAGRVVRSSGDLEKDYGPEVKSLREFVKQHSKSNSAVFAALHLSEVYSDYGKKQEALQVVSELSKEHKPGSFLSSLLWVELGNLQSELGQCEQAETSWKTVENAGSESGFFNKDLKIRMALCLKNSKPERSKELLKSLALDFPEHSAGRMAQRYLRSLHGEKK